MKTNNTPALTDFEATQDNRSFFCWDLIEFLKDSTWEEYQETWQQAKAGQCPFIERCNRYKKTAKKYGHQQKIQF